MVATVCFVEMDLIHINSLQKAPYIMCWNSTSLSVTGTHESMSRCTVTNPVIASSVRQALCFPFLPHEKPDSNKHKVV